VEKENKISEELDDEGRTGAVTFSVDVTSNLSALNKANISPLQRYLTACRLSELRFDRGKINFFHFSNLKCIETIFLELTEEYSKSIFPLRKGPDESFQDSVLRNGKTRDEPERICKKSISGIYLEGLG
jgi:hypothetical protein